MRSAMMSLAAGLILFCAGTVWAADSGPVAGEVKPATVWRVSSEGRFQTPPLVVVKRAPFGTAAGKAQSYEVEEHRAAASEALPMAFVGLTVLVLLGTLAVAWAMTSLRGSDGSRRRGFTLGAKLVLGFGGLATLIMLVSTLSIFSQHQSNDAAGELGGIVSDAQLLEDLQRDMLMVRMNVKDFLLTSSEQDLKQYSDYMANLQEKMRLAKEAIQNPERQKLLAEIEKDLETYEATFVQVVSVVDQRNGIVSSQMTPAAVRAGELLSGLIEGATAEGRLEVALKGSAAAETFYLGRASLLRFLRSGDPAEARDVVKQMDRARERLTTLGDAITEPAQRAVVAETAGAAAFYAQSVDTMIELGAKQSELVQARMDVIGPRIAQTGTKLLESISATQAQVEQAAAAASRLATVEAAISSLVAVALALIMSLVLIRAITNPIRSVLSTLHAVASGDLTIKALNMTSRDEMGELGRATDKMSTTLRELVLQVVQAAREVAAGATEIASSSEEMAQGMKEQTSQVTQISSAIEEMSASVVEVARKSADASTTAGESGQRATAGGQIVEQTVQGMRAISEAVSSGAASVQELGKRGEKIGQIIAVINDIADQTNLLALNAAIEAARAGQHGRGFAVVADEVRKLADRTTKATEEIAGSIRAIQDETSQAVERMNNGTEQVKLGVQKAQEAGQSLQAIVSGSRDVAQMIQSIAAAAEEQSAASEQVSRNVESISAVSKQAAEGASQAATAAAQLSSKAEELQRLVSAFRVDHAQSAAASRARAA